MTKKKELQAMKGKLLAIAAVGLMLSACNGNQQADNKGDASDQPSNAIKIEEDVYQLKSDDPTGIASIRKSWAKKTLKVDAGDSQVGIAQLAKAFCQEYTRCETNKALAEYLKDPDSNGESINVEGMSYNIEDLQANGFMCCQMLVETTPNTQVCYWNRKNGHKLFAAYMEHIHENGAFAEHLMVFYDYDPATGVMTPEPDLNVRLEKHIKNQDEYSIELPREGKDIVVYAYIVDDEGDSADDSEWVFVWNGDTFEWKK